MQFVQVWLSAGFVHHSWIIFRGFRGGTEAQLVPFLCLKQGITITNLIHAIL